MEDVLNKLTMEEGSLDDTEKLLAALKYACVISDDEVMALLAEYLAGKI